MARNRTQHGFTLIELMIVVTIIAILASVAVPNLLASRVVANERSVVAMMRTVATAMAQCRTQAAVDVDADGQGEAASFEELAGEVPVRGSPNPMQPPCLSAVFGGVDVDGHVINHGYLFALYLPDAAGDGLVATAANLPSVDTDLAETYWSCLAWPQDQRSKGIGTLFVNQNGEILMAKSSTYNGKTSVPPPGAALRGVPPTSIVGNLVATGAIGADGNLWRPVQ